MKEDKFNVKTYSIKQRDNLVHIKDFAKCVAPVEGFEKFMNSLPCFLAAKDFRRLVKAVCTARKENHPVIVAMGAHVIKTGTSNLIIDLMKQGLITAVATNGAGAIHDLEIALIGATSENVEQGIYDGSFGMAEETAQIFARASSKARQEQMGLGEAIGHEIIDGNYAHKNYSVLATGVSLNIPVTVHVAIGTDIVHMHPVVSGADIGEASMNDFKRIARCVRELEGGVWINLGSAVILPEVFLKVVNIARNEGYRLKEFTTANLDMINHYRPRVNVVERPAGHRGISIIGHHEIIIPLLRMALLTYWNIDK